MITEPYKTECDNCGQLNCDGLYYSNINYIGEHKICDGCLKQIKKDNRNELN